MKNILSEDGKKELKKKKKTVEKRELCSFFQSQMGVKHHQVGIKEICDIILVFKNLILISYKFKY